MVQINTFAKIFLTLCFLTICTACSNHKQQNYPNTPLEDAYQKIAQNNLLYSKSNLVKLKRNLSTFTQYDDIYGQWLANYHIANYWITTKELDKALKSSQQAFEFARISQDNQAQFKSTFQVAQITKNINLMEESLNYVTSPFEKAVVLAHLNRTMEAYELIKSQLPSNKPQHANNIAFVLFQHAQLNELDELVLLSKEYYIKAKNSNGVIDCLFWLAKFYLKHKRDTLAKQFATRAKNASDVIKNDYKSNAITSWMENKL